VSSDPAGKKVEIEFVPGSNTWTDVTTDVDWGVGISTKYGRSTQWSDPQSATITFRLDNHLGTYTPGAQLLKDGVTASPHWPYVLPGARVRYSYTVSGSPQYRFWGYITSWPPLLDNGVLAYTTVTAVDRMGYLSSVVLDNSMVRASLADNAYLLYTLGDATGSTTAASSTNNGLALSATQYGTGGAIAFGVGGPDVEQQTGLSFGPADINDGVYLSGVTSETGNQYPNTPITHEIWFTTTVNPAVSTVRTLYYAGPTRTGPNYVWAYMVNGGQVQVNINGALIYGSSTAYNDGAYHQLIVGGTTAVTNFYIDGALVGTTASNTGIQSSFPVDLYLGECPTQVAVTSSLFSGYLAFYGCYLAMLSATQVTTHYNARLAVAGEITSARVTRYLTYAGLASGEMTIATGSQAIGQHPILGSGKDCLSACNELALTEGGGSLFYILPNGNARFTDRHYRNPTTPVITVDATKDVVFGDWQPAFDNQGLLKQSTVTQQGGMVETYLNPLAALTNGIESITSYCALATDALQLAEYRVNANAFPALRFPTFSVNLTTCQTSGLDTALASAQLGDRIRIINLPAGIAGGSQVDVIMEGYADNYQRPTGYLVTFDSSPADNPPRGLWQDTNYGRWRPQTGTCTLNATITASATSLGISNTSLAFTTTSGSYPFDIWIGTERITLTTAPTGSAPQAFTGITRGVAGTFASPHTAGVVIDLAPGATWQL
jgi:hypothetical protein